MSNHEKKKQYLNPFENENNSTHTEGQNGHAYHGFEEQEDFYDEDEEDLPYSITDELDHAILMHRDAHFGGDFAVMINYYQNEDHIGIQPDFDLERIETLAETQEQLGQDLAPMILTVPEAEHISRSRRAYEQLKEIYEIEHPKSELPRLIADLMLTEVEEPEEEIEAVVNMGERIVPDLLRIITSDECFDPLFPGYGLAPYLAALCLGKIGDERAIVPLFELLGREMVFEEDVAVYALAEIGEPAKEFLLKILKSRPITQDNVNAAYALTAFADEPDVAIASFEQLQDQTVRSMPLLRSYLLSNCEILSDNYRDAFEAMLQDSSISKEFKTEIKEFLH